LHLPSYIYGFLLKDIVDEYIKEQDLFKNLEKCLKIMNKIKYKNGIIVHADCLEAMKLIEDKSIDMILCDLPFQITACKWDIIIPFDLLWEQYNRIIKKDGTIALFASQPFTTKLISSNERDFRYCWYWLKNQGTNFFHAKRMPIRKIEEICVFKKGKYYPQITDGHISTNSAKGCSNGKTYHGTNIRDYKGGKTTRFPTNILEFKCVDNYSRLHSSQKPVALFEYLIKTYTNEGDLVLDNCIGSGTTAIASINTNRNFIGIEKEQKYFDISRKRIEDKLLEVRD
jgi:site-specific DNA-methyltransferase (adenine-specific)